MPWKYNPEDYKNYTRESWDECAANYLPIMRQLLPFHSELLKSLKLRPGQRILDVATGPGEPALTIAKMVAPAGQAIGIDLSQNMIKIARKNASKRKLRNVEFLTMDAEKLEMPSNSFDMVVSCFGFQIITRPEAAAREMFRVLKPGGHCGLTVWSTGDKTPAIDVMVGPMMEHAEPDETGYLPSPFELGAPGELTTLLERIGFEQVEEHRINGEFHASDEKEYFKMLMEGTPLGHSILEEEPEIQREILQKTRANIASYRTRDGVSIAAECVIVIASKPSDRIK